MTASKIGEKEAIAYIVTTIIGKIFLTYPAVIIAYAANAAWAVVLLSGLVTLFFLYFVVKLVTTFPGKPFPEICRIILGSYLGPVIGILPMVGWIIEEALLLRNFSESMLVVALPETPLSTVVFCFVAACTIAVYLGIENIIRACYISFPFILAAILTIALLSFNTWRTDLLFPLLGKGALPVLKAGIIRSSDFLEVTALYILPILFYSKQVKRIGVRAVIISTAIFLVVIITFSMSFPFPVGEEPYLPLYMMARGVYLSDFLQRIEAIFVIFWVFAGLLLLSAGFYVLCIIFAQTLKLPDYKPLILPMAIITFALAFAPPSLPDAVRLSNYTVREWAWVVFYGIPIILLVVARLRGG
jgi:spore germination protein KB